MEPFRSVLVDVDSAASSHPALERAVDLARATGARLTIVDAMTMSSHEHRDLPAGIAEAMLTRQRQLLAGLANSVVGVPTEWRLLAGRPATALIQEVIGSGHDVILRSHARDVAASRPQPFGAVDMELLRKCPCAVFLVRHGGRDGHRFIAGAINAQAKEPVEQALNTKIIELTLSVASFEDGIPMLLHTWAPFAEAMIHSYASDDAYRVYAEDVRKRADQALRRLATSFGDRLSGVPVVSRRGRPEDVIPAFAVSEGIDLVVMGTMARTGLANLLIGNTAERILAKLPCSVLAVKPDGFVSPVRLDDI